MEIVREVTGRDLVTGHNAGTAFTRPDWARIFRQLRDEHGVLSWVCQAGVSPADTSVWPGGVSAVGEEIGVFFCGPEGLASILRRYCERFSSVATNTRFKFRKEVF